jgi:hypothetical protein
MSMGLLNRTAIKKELKGVHLCCYDCVDGVGVAMKDVEGSIPIATSETGP